MMGRISRLKLTRSVSAAIQPIEKRQPTARHPDFPMARIMTPLLCAAAVHTSRVRILQQTSVNWDRRLPNTGAMLYSTLSYKKEFQMRLVWIILSFAFVAA